MDEKNADVSEPEVEELKEEVERLQEELQKQKAREHRPFPWRNLIAWILVILATILAIAAPLASWGHDYLLDTNRFVDTVAPLIKEDEVAQAISERAASRLIEELDIQDRLDQVLPEEITFIAGPITNGVETLAQKAGKTILQSDQFYFVWEKMLTFAHSTAVEAIKGGGALEVTEQGDIILDIGELLQELQSRLIDAGLTFLDKVSVPSDAGTVVLFTSDELGIAKNAVDLVDTLNWILPVLAIIFFAAAVLISTDRRKFLMLSGLGIALAMAVSLIALNFAENQLLKQIKLPANLSAAEIVWNTLFENLVAIQAGILALGVVVAAGAAVAGPYKWAVWLRTRTAHLFEAWQDRRHRGVKEPGPVGKFVETYKMAFRIGGIALVVLILLLLPEVTLGAVIGSTVALLVYLAIIELVRSPEPKEAAEGAAEEETAPEDKGEESAGESKDETPAADEKKAEGEDETSAKEEAGEEGPPKEE